MHVQHNNNALISLNLKSHRHEQSRSFLVSYDKNNGMYEYFSGPCYDRMNCVFVPSTKLIVKLTLAIFSWDNPSGFFL